MKSKMAYEILIEKETHTKFSICELPLNRQTSKSRRKKLMVETQPQTSVNKKSGSKCKRDDNGKLELPKCPACKTNTKTKNHHNYECPTIKKFRKIVTKELKHRKCSGKEWNLDKSTERIVTDMVIAKKRWMCHCERCNTNQKKKD